MKYLEKLPEVQSAAGAALLDLGDGNWKMGEGAPLTAKAKGPKLGAGDEQVILSHYVCASFACLLSPENTHLKSFSVPQSTW